MSGSKESFETILSLLMSPILFSGENMSLLVAFSLILVEYPLICGAGTSSVFLSGTISDSSKYLLCPLLLCGCIILPLSLPLSVSWFSCG